MTQTIQKPATRKRSIPTWLTITWAAATLSGVACTSSSDELAGTPGDTPAAVFPEREEIEPGVTLERFMVQGAVPPANPLTGQETPVELNRVQVLRYRQSGNTPEASAVIVAVPGFAGGAMGFDTLARALVRRGIAADAAIEVWAIDRRSNLLEDRRGLDAAEIAQDPSLARSYYRGESTVGGEQFTGFLAQEDASFMSEWGLATLIGDIRAVIAQVPAQDRRAHVFLLGHSLGGALVEAYSAWQFADGTRAADELAGILILDGGASEVPMTPEDYEQSGFSFGGAVTSPGLAEIRAGTRFFAIPPYVDAPMFAELETLALAAHYQPDEVNTEATRVAATALGMESLPVSHRTAFGLALDDEYGGVLFTGVSAGKLAGGPVDTFTSPLFGVPRLRPQESAASYEWVDALASEPAEFTELERMAHLWHAGASNFAEWYFPLRLFLDVFATGNLQLAEDSWQAAYGLRAFAGAEIDAPILAVAGPLRSAESFTPLRQRVAPIGPGRRAAGATRDLPSAFRIVDATFMNHMDVITASDRPENPVPAAIEAFVREHAGTDRITVAPRTP